MFKVAVIEDDIPTSNSSRRWILAARPDVSVDQWFTRDDAEAAIAREAYAVVVLDIELGRERHAGVAIINAINKTARGTPVLVVSAMPATIYRSIMKALDAWDYLQKTTFEEADFIDTFLEILRASARTPSGAAKAERWPPAMNCRSTRCARARRCGAASASTCRSPPSASSPRSTSGAARWSPTTNCSRW